MAQTISGVNSPFLISTLHNIRVYMYAGMSFYLQVIQGKKEFGGKTENNWEEDAFIYRSGCLSSC